MKNEKEINGDVIAGILTSINNCNDCPIHLTCNKIENVFGKCLCKQFKEIDNLNIIF